MARYILTDYYGEEPKVEVFKNKDQVIQRLLGMLGEIRLEVEK
jgi:hypothetical protein